MQAYAGALDIIIFLSCTEKFTSVPSRMERAICYFLWYPDCDTAPKVEGFALENIHKFVVFFFIYSFIFALKADLNSSPYAFF